MGYKAQITPLPQPHPNPPPLTGGIHVSEREKEWTASNTDTVREMDLC